MVPLKIVSALLIVSPIIVPISPINNIDIILSIPLAFLGLAIIVACSVNDYESKEPLELKDKIDHNKCTIGSCNQLINYLSK
ncbi:MAG: hypothetical protein HDQ98_03880 [Lachnospiraceae bacterium]|nr:hypothetical protein [Lachnospiraceae bacterium]